MIERRIIVRELPQEEIDEYEALRYAGVRAESDSALELLSECRKRLIPSVKGLTVYRVLDFSCEGDECIIGGVSVRSASLARAMQGAEAVVVFAATVGIEVDRVIARYQKTSAALAHMASSLASERIESLCDALCRALSEELADEYTLTQRFSAGYGDLPIEFQRKIFSMLNPEKYIGLTLGASLLMSPSKSVSAIIGLKRK